MPTDIACDTQRCDAPATAAPIPPAQAWETPWHRLEALPRGTWLLGVVNSVLKPLIIFLTLPLTLVTLGFFLLVINALMLMLVSTLVRGFTVSGFWTAFFASLFIGFVNGVVEWMVSSNGEIVMQAPFGTGGGRWI